MTTIFSNFNWETFFIALAAFFIIQSLINFIIARISLSRANKNVERIEKEYLKLTKTLAKKDKELNDLLSNKEGG